MKVFLSSTVNDLRDARLSLIEQIERACENRVTLVCYERDGRRHPMLPPEETCLSLVQACDAFIILFDKYYGTPSRTVPEISITHAELREALKRKLIVIPVVRTQTWYEYLISRKNSGRQVSYANVQEPRLFEMLDEVFTKYNCHIYDNLTGKEAISEIATALNSVISGGATGIVQHVTLPAEEGTTSAAPKTMLTTEVVPLFANGQVLRATDLNSLYLAVVEVAKSRGLLLTSAVTWASGQTLKAEQLNALLDDVARIYTHCGLTIPIWSFGQFQNRQVLRASQLNEISEHLKALIET